MVTRRTLLPNASTGGCPRGDGDEWGVSFVPAGQVLQRTETTPGQAAIFKALGVTEPKRFLAIAPATAGRPAGSA